MPTVFIPSSLRRYTAGQSKAEVSAGTIDQVFEDLERQYPGVKSRLCDDSGQIKRYVNIFVNDEEILKTVSHGGEPQEVCQALLDLALDRGGKDNVTVVLARYDIPAEHEGEPR